MYYLQLFKVERQNCVHSFVIWRQGEELSEKMWSLDQT